MSIRGKRHPQGLSSRVDLVNKYFFHAETVTGVAPSNAALYKWQLLKRKPLPRLLFEYRVVPSWQQSICSVYQTPNDERDRHLQKLEESVIMRVTYCFFPYLCIFISAFDNMM